MKPTTRRVLATAAVLGLLAGCATRLPSLPHPLIAAAPGVAPTIAVAPPAASPTTAWSAFTTSGLNACCSPPRRAL